MKYYHAGAQITKDDGDVIVNWSDHTRRNKAVAEDEARRLARRYEAKPVVEYWSREHGLRPGWDCAEAAYDVSEEAT